MTLALVVILVIVILGLMIYNMKVYKKIENFNNLNQKVISLSVLQDFMETLGEDIAVTDKIKKINDVVIEKYNIKYSTIVVYDGAEYQIAATNVDSKHWDTLRNLHNDPIFADSIQTSTPKYITVEKEGERLPYQKSEFARAKSAMFFPLYIDNVYIGYWILESGMPHDFDSIDTTILDVVKNNIVSSIKTLQNQTTIENIVRDDQFSGLKSAEYLYGEGKRQADQYPTSAICMFKITNIQAINLGFGRHTGNDVITQVAKVIKSSIATNYVFVRYMGPKFVILFSGMDEESIKNYLEDTKKLVETLEILQNKADLLEPETGEPKTVSPVLNFAVATYYKGTALEGTTKKLEEYLDSVDQKESTINYLQ